MASFQIVSAQGVDLGVYQAATAADALDAMVRDAGYRDQADAAAVAGPFDGTVTEVATHAVRDYDSDEMLAGIPSERLVRESAPTPTGAECAYLADGVWHWLDASRVDDYRRMGETVRTVYVAS